MIAIIFKYIGLENIEKEKDLNIQDLKKNLDTLTCQVSASVVKIATTHAFRTEAFAAEMQMKNTEQTEKLNYFLVNKKQVVIRIFI